MCQSETVGNSGTALMSKCNVAYLHSDYANSFVKPGAHRPQACRCMPGFLKLFLCKCLYVYVLVPASEVINN